MSDCPERSAGNHHTQSLKKRIVQLETEVRALRKQAPAQRQSFAQKYAREFLALIDGDRNAVAVIIDKALVKE